MSVHFATSEEILTWDARLLANPDGGNVFASHEMATIKQNTGWRARYIIVDTIAITVLERYVFPFGKLWYLPKGPGITDTAELSQFLKSLRVFAKKHSVFLVKIEPELLKTDKTTAFLSEQGLHYAGSVQPNASTVLIDLKPSLETILTTMPQKARHAIRRASRDGLIIKQAPIDDEHLSIMLALMKETMQDKATHLRDDAYYFTFWKQFAQAGGALFIAYDGDEPVASAYVLKFGNKATYKDGGSVKRKTIYGASHALQWAIIEWLKESNVIVYDLCGAPPSSQRNNEKHPHYGIGLFKTGFNKTITDYVGAYDIPIRPLTYKLWNKIGHRVVTRFYYSVLKKYFY